MKTVFPVPVYKDGRHPGISSSYRSSDRPDHVGVDVMYPRKPEDGGPPGKNKSPHYARRWYMPHGVPAFAYSGGTVTESYKPSKGGYIRIEHPGGWQSQYMHLSRRDKQVGDRVAAGEQIGLVGGDPTSGGLIHLHFQLRKNGTLVNPAQYLQVAELRSWPGANWLLWGTVAAVGGWFIGRFVRR